MSTSLAPPVPDAQVSSEETARQARAQVKRLTDTFSLDALRAKLPLRFPSPAAPSSDRHFRTLSWYRYPGQDELAQAKSLEAWGDLYLALHLIDFSPVRMELVALTHLHQDGRGQTPFDPVSLFLGCVLHWEKGLSWTKVAGLLAGPEGGCWRRLLGFQDEHTPSASTLRHFYHSLGAAFEADLGPRFIELLQSAQLLPDQSTHPKARPDLGLPVTVDGMLHEAHSSMRCGQVTDTCYQPTFPHDPRPCPAKSKGFEGCDCTDPACQQVCHLATWRDPEARLIHYAGRNQDGETEPARSRNVYGYRSYAALICDDELHTAWVALSAAYPATTDERVIFPRQFDLLRLRLPTVRLGEVIGDAALAYADCLNPIYQAGLIPVIAIRHDPTDDDPTACLLRGYDKNGHPLCAHGYPMTFNGVDYDRLRACWACRQVCAHSSLATPQDAECPFRDPDHPLGQIVHVDSAFTHPDGSRHERLARLYPYNGPLWKDHYARRKNMVESRNSQFARLGLKRIWSYGLSGVATDVAFVDFLVNLRTLARLVRQATLLTT